MGEGELCSRERKPESKKLILANSYLRGRECWLSTYSKCAITLKAFPEHLPLRNMLSVVCSLFPSFLNSFIPAGNESTWTEYLTARSEQSVEGGMSVVPNNCLGAHSILGERQMALTTTSDAVTPGGAGPLNSLPRCCLPTLPGGGMSIWL